MLDKDPADTGLPAVRGCIAGTARRFTAAFERNRGTLLLCLLATFVWGLAAHAYLFFQDSFSHDSLHEFNAEVFGNEWKIRLGRIFVPVYRMAVRGSLTLPWLIGLLSLLYIAAAVFLTVKLFDIRSKVLTVLMAGVFTANLTVTATAATYINDLDGNMLALALAVLAVYLWKAHGKGLWMGMIPLCLSIGLYQSYISVTVTMVILYLILLLLEGERSGTVFKKGLGSLAMILGGGLLYALSLAAAYGITGISYISGNYNSMDTMLSMSPADVIRTALKGYEITVKRVLLPASPYPRAMTLALHIGLAAAVGTVILLNLLWRALRERERVMTLAPRAALIAALIALLPFSMDAVYALTGGRTHDLMHFAYWLTYGFALLIAWRAMPPCRSCKPILRQGVRVLTAVLVVLVLWGNVQTANAAYLKKDLEGEAQMSLLTRVLYRMEDCDGYVTGETPVVFVGIPDGMIEPIPGFEHTYKLIGSGLWYVLGAAERDYYQAYFTYILTSPAVMADAEVWARMQEDDRVSEMTCYPEAGGVQMIDGVMVVKLGEGE